MATDLTRDVGIGESCRYHVMDGRGFGGLALLIVSNNVNSSSTVRIRNDAKASPGKRHRARRLVVVDVRNIAVSHDANVSVSTPPRLTGAFLSDAHTGLSRCSLTDTNVLIRASTACIHSLEWHK